MISGDARVAIHVSTVRDALCPPARTLTELTVRVMNGENVTFLQVGIILADHEIVTDLNRRFLDHDRPTDVLSFRLNDEAPLEGEVYVDVETAAERCEEFGTTPADEILRYVVHGLLHLAGYDDSTAEERTRMQVLEDRYLSGLSGD